jgi:hypothetical protein
MTDAPDNEPFKISSIFKGANGCIGEPYMVQTFFDDSGKVIDIDLPPTAKKAFDNLVQGLEKQNRKLALEIISSQGQAQEAYEAQQELEEEKEILITMIKSYVKDEEALKNKLATAVEALQDMNALFSVDGLLRRGAEVNSALALSHATLTEIEGVDIE